MRRQLKLYVQRQLANAMEVSVFFLRCRRLTLFFPFLKTDFFFVEVSAGDSNYQCTTLFVLKVLSVGMDEIHNALQIPIAAKGSGALSDAQNGDGDGHGAAAKNNSSKLWPATPRSQAGKSEDSASGDRRKRDGRAVSGVYVCVCVCVYVCMYMYVCMYVHVRVCIHVCM